jgi:hypothetical protein
MAVYYTGHMLKTKSKIIPLLRLRIRAIYGRETKSTSYILADAFFDFLVTLLFRSNTSTSHNSLMLQAVMKFLSLVGGEGSSRT